LSDPWNESKALTWLGGSTYGRSFKHSVPMDDETPRVLGSRPPVTAASARMRGAADRRRGGRDRRDTFVGLVGPHATRAGLLIPIRQEVEPLCHRGKHGRTGVPVVRDTVNVPARSQWGVTPRESIAAECARRGRSAVVDGCVRLVMGEETDVRLVAALAGPAARRVLAGDSRADLRYWLRVWGARGLLWEWDSSASAAVAVALRDPAWRVREMAAKIVARHLLGDELPAVAALRDDPVPRVRAAAERAVVELIRTGA
jgi:hypothetical protein